MTLRSKLYLLSLAIPGILAVIITAISTIAINRIVYELHHRLLTAELNLVLRDITEEHNSLAKSGVEDVPNYIEMAQTTIFEKLRRNEYSLDSEVFIVSLSDRTEFHPSSHGGRMEHEFPEGFWLEDHGDFVFKCDDQPVFCVYTTFPQWNWRICLMDNLHRMHAQRNTYLWAVACICGIMLAISLVVAFLLTRALLRRFSATIECVNQAEEGNLTAMIDTKGARDELGRLQTGINNMIKRIKIRTEERERAEEILIQLNEELTATNEELNSTNEELTTAYDELAVSQRDLAESEKLFRTYYELGLVGMVMITPDRKWIDLNDRFCSILGYSRDELMGLGWTDIIHPEDRRIELSQWERMLRGVLPGYQTNCRFIKKDGETLYAALSVNRPGKGNTEIEYAVAMVQDLTEHRRLEQKMRHSQKLEAIGTLAGGIAHDFNNMLFAIIGNADLALESRDLSIENRDNLEEILKAAKRAAKLVEQILSFARQTEIKQSEVQLSPIVKEAVKMLRSTLPANIEITTEITDPDAYVYGDPTQLHQVLVNLCTNAGHAMMKTGGRLGIQIDRTEISEDKHQPGKLPAGSYVRLRVSDTGCGMPKEILELIFDPFFTTKEQGQGTGMGLAVVHGIVSGMQGSVTVESEPGRGSVFTILLPLRQVTEQEKEVDAMPMASGNEHVLLVDDEASIVRITKTLLSRLGYEVTAFTSSTEALSGFRNSPEEFDLVITDQSMPEMTGGELAREILNTRPDIPVILCTGFSYVMDSGVADDIGIREFLTKPVSRTDLAQAIRRVLK